MAAQEFDLQILLQERGALKTSLAERRHQLVATKVAEASQFNAVRIIDRAVPQLLVSLLESARGRTVLFAGAEDGVGKRALISWLAALGGKAGYRALVVDSAVGEPGLREAFGRPLEAGLAEALVSGVPLSELVVSVEEQIDLISAGTASVQAAAEPYVDAVGRQLEEMATGYSLVLVDSPALRTSPLATRFWTLSRQMLCVLDATQCTADQVVDVVRQTKGYPHEIRFVLNKVKCRADYLSTG